MRSAVLRTLLAGASVLLFASPGRSEPAAAATARLRLTAPAPLLDPAPGDGRVAPRIAGFGMTARPGEPLLPLRVLLVAIPEESIPVLRIRSASSRFIDGADVAPVPARRAGPAWDAAGGDERGAVPAGMEAAGHGPSGPGLLEYAADPAIFGSGAEYPAAPLRLGRTGYLREQRFVEVFYTPVLYRPGERRLRHVAAIDAEIEMRPAPGADPRAWERTLRPDPLFEPIYRDALVNYEQGRAWRVGPGEAVGAAAARPDASGAGSHSGGTETSATLEATPSSGSVLTEISPAVTTTGCGVRAPAPYVPPPPVTPGTGRYKLLVSQAGIVRIDQATLAASAPDLAAADPATLVLRAEGAEVPIAILDREGRPGDGDGRFDTGDALEFYGRPRTEPPALCNHDYGDTFPDVFQANDFTDTQAYWLTSEDPPGGHARLTATLDGAPVAGLPPAADFEAEAVWDDDTIYQPLGDADPFFSIPSLVAGGSQAQRDIAVALPGLAPAAAAATVAVRLRGGSSVASVDPDHRTRVWVNADSAGGADFLWDGETIFPPPGQTAEFTVAQSSLSDPAVVHVSLPGVAGTSVDRQYLDTVTVRYRRTFVASSDLLTFSWPNQDARFTISGFSGPGPTIYEISADLPGTGQAAPVRVTGAAAGGVPGNTTYTFEVRRDPRPETPAVRTFAVAGPCAVTAGGCRLALPDAIVRVPEPGLADPANAADYLVIAAPGTIDAAPGGALDRLLAHRRATQGLTGRVVFVDRIYDEFSNGLRDPDAIRSFLNYAFDNWRGADGLARPPAFVLLVGDASPDYKNTLRDALGPGSYVDQVPTMMMFQAGNSIGYYSSDNWLASFRGADQLPDLFLGRITARTADASARVFEKILRYEQSPPPGLWKGRSVLVASDGANVSEPATFEAAQETIAARHFARPPYAVAEPRLYFTRAPWNGTDAAGFKADLVTEINAGAALLSYMGHGGFDTWGRNASLFRTADAAALGSAAGLPFMVNVNCLSGGFHYLLAAGSIGEAMTNNPDGGAIATLAPSGLSSEYVLDDVVDTVVGDLFGPRRERLLGRAATTLRLALWSAPKVVDLQGITFLGDPATLLATPAPAPPSGLVAVAGNGEVGLSWTVPTEAVAGIRIYRATESFGAPGPYAPVACDPVDAVSCVDRGVLNATTYYYYAVSLDPEGFEGRASNFNTDCAASGPDCVNARPWNPGPPSVPAGLAVRDPGTGGRLEVSWLPNPEKDMKAYILYWGTVPGTYPNRLTIAAPTTAATLAGLTDAVRYYVTVSATNTSGHESARAPEVAGVPHLIQGIAPPRAISDLMLARSGPDLVLSWSRPTVDIYGRPTTVVRYHVYRGDTPGFLPFAAGPHLVVTDGAVTTAVDPGAHDLPRSLYYLVTAVDASGLMSGAGRELPNGIGDLAVSIAGPGTLRLAWSAVVTDVQGLPTIIDRYQVHASPRPVPRAALGPSTLVLDDVRGTSADLVVDLSAGSGPLHFSVIAVDDRGNLSPF